MRQRCVMSPKHAVPETRAWRSQSQPWLRLLLAALLSAWLSPTAATADKDPVRIIIDTDFETDVDDVAALALAHAFADSGKAEILGVAVAGTHELSGPAIASVNTYYGRPNIPVGVRRSGGVHRQSSYTRLLVDGFPAPFDAQAALDSVSLYRRLLAAQEDSSVVVVSLGYLTNLSDLLDSKADQYSELSGAELVAKKVRRYVCMGGTYPEQLETGAWGNFLPDGPAVVRVNRDWPTPIVFTGGGPFSRSVPTGRAFLHEFPASSLMRLSYEQFFENASWATPPDHHSADLIAIYVAVEGVGPFFVETRKGHNHIWPNGTMEWQEEPDDPLRSYVADLAPGIAGEEVGQFFETLIFDAGP